MGPATWAAVRTRWPPRGRQARGPVYPSNDQAPGEEEEEVEVVGLVVVEEEEVVELVEVVEEEETPM